MSDSWPVKVCLHMPSRTSQSLAEASQAPETNNRESGAKDKLMTSPVWPAKVVVCWPVSMSQSALQDKIDRRFSSTIMLRKSIKCWLNGACHSPSGISRACYNLVVIKKATTGQVSWGQKKKGRGRQTICFIGLFFMIVSANWIKWMKGQKLSRIYWEIMYYIWQYWQDLKKGQHKFQ